MKILLVVVEHVKAHLTKKEVLACSSYEKTESDSEEEVDKAEKNMMFILICSDVPCHISLPTL